MQYLLSLGFGIHLFLFDLIISKKRRFLNFQFPFHFFTDTLPTCFSGQKSAAAPQKSLPKLYQNFTFSFQDRILVLSSIIGGDFHGRPAADIPGVLSLRRQKGQSQYTIQCGESAAHRQHKGL
jgi:hypothetical protein